MTYERTTGTQYVVQKSEPWTKEEDAKLTQIVQKIEEQVGTIERGYWIEIAKRIPGRTNKQCYKRWNRHINPSINKEEWTPEEDKLLIKKQRELGNKWKIIANSFSGRTGDSIRNRWYCLQRRKKIQNPQGQPIIYQQPPQQKTQQAPSSDQLLLESLNEASEESFGMQNVDQFLSFFK